MGKRRRGRGAPQPTTNNFWRNIGQSYTNLDSNPASSSSANFQAPHHQTDAIEDLTDDTSPNIPTPTTEQQQNNQEPQAKSPIVRLNPALQNKQNEKHYLQAARNLNMTQKGVIQGAASDIKLFNTKAVAVEMEKPASPSTSGDKTFIIQETTVDSPKSTPPKTGGIFILDTKTINSRADGSDGSRPQQYRLPGPQKASHLNLHQRSQGAQGPPLMALGAADPFGHCYPKGIPRSFLRRSNDPATPQPYTDMTKNLSDLNTSQPWQQVSRFTAEPSVPKFDYTSPVQDTTENPIFVDTVTEGPVVDKQAYSPSDVYSENATGNPEEEPREGSESPDMLEPGQKRLSAFQRLGPLTQPKKPKMTINLMCNKDQSVREVVDETEQKYVPVHLRDDIVNSTDETVVKYLKLWPWQKGLELRKTVMPRNSKSVMILEHEQMDEIYEKNWLYIQVSVQGYPREWTKEKLMDTIMDAVNGKSFIPLFIEFAPQECKFLVIRCRTALNMLHKLGLVVKLGSVELKFAISQTGLDTTKNDFIPKLVLRKRLALRYDNEKSLDLSHFTTKEDISHFIYYPLNRASNQTDLVQLKSTVAWHFLTDLNLSHNKITSIDGFNLPMRTPKLQRLDLSYNCIEKATLLLRCRDLNLRSLKLEGNPLCHDYIDPGHYVRVLKLMFPALTEIDGEPIVPCGEMPKFKRNYCPEDAKELVERFLEVFFPLLDAQDSDRATIEDLYHEQAVMTITYRYKLRYGQIHRQFRTLFNRSRVIAEGDTECINGASDIARLINKWPPLKHDPYTFTVDVLHHDDSATIFKVAGILKLTAESLAEDEHLVSFSRTFVLRPAGSEYQVAHELLYWDLPDGQYAERAFQITTVRPKRLALKLESPPDEDLKKKLVDIFIQLTELSRDASEKCLEHRDWNLKMALEYFMKLVKLDEVEILSK